MMKRTVLPVSMVALIIISCISATAQTGYVVADKVKPKAVSYSLSDVRLLESPFKNAMDLDAKWLLSLEPDRFLNRFRLNAGLKPKGKIYGGWESRGVSGHSLGHYLSACAMMYAASGDERFKQKTDYIVKELTECQAARKTGYVGGIPDEDKIWNEVASGDIRSQGFDLNGGWVPWYTEHKVLAGLIDAYTYAGNKQAKTVALKFGDWADAKFKNLTEAQFQKMLDCEHGGMNESLADLYAISGDKKYLALSYRFHHKKVLDPLAAGEDKLAGLHANTQIPKIIGAARRYELTGDKSDEKIASFFWNTVTKNHSYVIGGNSDHEHFGQPNQLAGRLSDQTTETCNTYNMLKLTRHLYRQDPSAAYMDYYERALYNHILASQNPQTGMVCYYVPLVADGKKIFGTPDDSFWCCTGTGMENHVKYGESIYFKGDDGSIYVNLFIPSVLNEAKKGIKLQLQSQYPESQNIRLKITDAKKALNFPMHIRYPKWAVSGAMVKVNGKPEKVTAKPGSYITLDHTWKKGDEISISFPMTIYTEALPGNTDKKAFLYGPVVLAGSLGEQPVKTWDIPVVIASNTNDDRSWIKPVLNRQLEFTTTANVQPENISLKPFYNITDQHYAVYWDYFSPAEWVVKKKEFDAARRREADREARTLDMMRVGEMQPERDHNFTGENTNTGEAGSRKWRDARDGGWFSFTMDTKSMKNALLEVTYYGSDKGSREFDILIDGMLIATEKLAAKKPDEFYEESYALPEKLLAGKKAVTVKFQAKPGNTAGGIFGARLMKK